MNRICFVRNVRILTFLFGSVVFDTHLIDMSISWKKESCNIFIIIFSNNFDRLNSIWYFDSFWEYHWASDDRHDINISFFFSIQFTTKFLIGTTDDYRIRLSSSAKADGMVRKRKNKSILTTYLRKMFIGDIDHRYKSSSSDRWLNWHHRNFDWYFANLWKYFWRFDIDNDFLRNDLRDNQISFYTAFQWRTTSLSKEKLKNFSELVIYLHSKLRFSWYMKYSTARIKKKKNYLKNFFTSIISFEMQYKRDIFLSSAYLPIYIYTVYRSSKFLFIWFCNSSNNFEIDQKYERSECQLIVRSRFTEEKRKSSCLAWSERLLRYFVSNSEARRQSWVTTCQFVWASFVRDDCTSSSSILIYDLEESWRWSRVHGMIHSWAPIIYLSSIW